MTPERGNINLLVSGPRSSSIKITKDTGNMTLMKNQQKQQTADTGHSTARASDIGIMDLSGGAAGGSSCRLLGQGGLEEMDY